VRPAWAISPPGVYTRLRRGDCVFMTDQHDEWWTQRIAIEEACRRGSRVLLTGLGLGLVVQSMFDTPGTRVEHIVVVESSQDVISLVKPHIVAAYGDRIVVHHADAFEWSPPPGGRFTVVWHDIWDNPQDPQCRREEARLLARYAPYGDWQGTWPATWRAAERMARPQA